MSRTNVWDKKESRWVGQQEFRSPTMLSTYQASYQPAHAQLGQRSSPSQRTPRANTRSTSRSHGGRGSPRREEYEYGRGDSQLSRSSRGSQPQHERNTQYSRRGSERSLASGPADAEAMYRNALAVSDAVPVETMEEPAEYVTKKFVRQLEVPVKRDVKVPVKMKKVVPVMREKRVPVKRIVEVPAFTTVQEEYVDVEERDAVREKEVWVKQVIQEPYKERVEVVKRRDVQVPTTEFREVDDVEVVQVTENVVMEVDGYRVDEVEDTKLVEVEEYQTYRMEPTATGEVRTGRVRTLPSHSRGQRLGRRVGADVYDARDGRLCDFDTDSQVSRRSYESRPWEGSLRSGRSGSRVQEDDLVSEVSYVSWE